jgi:hypothetical protein
VLRQARPEHGVRHLPEFLDPQPELLRLALVSQMEARLQLLGEGSPSLAIPNTPATTPLTEPSSLNTTSEAAMPG